MRGNRLTQTFRHIMRRDDPEVVRMTIYGYKCKKKERNRRIDKIECDTKIADARKIIGEAQRAQ